MSKIIKLLSIFIVFLISFYSSYLSYFFFKLVVWNTLAWTYYTYSLWKEIIINTGETKDNIISWIKKWIYNVIDSDKADEIAIISEEKKQQDLEDEAQRKKEQEKTKLILSSVPYLLSIITFIFIFTFSLKLLMNLWNTYKKLILWIKD